MDRSLYEEHAALELEHWWFVSRRAIIERVLIDHLPADPSRRIVDIGCGTGGMLPMLSGFGHVVGIEGDELAVEHCRVEFPRFNVQLGEIPADIPSNGSFDVATAFDVIEHIDNEQAALESLRSAVRPGGTMVVTVPALSWLWSDHDVMNGHKRRYSRNRLAQAIARAGFDLAHLSYFNTVLLPVVAGTRIAQGLVRRGGAPRSDFAMPSLRVNHLLTRMMSSERGRVAGHGLPVGVSLLAVARRPA